MTNEKDRKDQGGSMDQKKTGDFNHQKNDKNRPQGNERTDQKKKDPAHS